MSAEFAQARLEEAGETEALGRAHAEYYTTLAEEVDAAWWSTGRLQQDLLQPLDPERDNDTVVVDRFIELIAPFVHVRATEQLRLDLVIAVRIADSLTRYAFERDPNGDVDVLEETKRVVRAHLSRALGDPQVS